MSEAGKTDRTIGQPDQRQPGRSTVGNVVEGTSSGFVTLVHGTENVVSETIHALGRVGTTVIEEVFGLVATAVAGVSDTAGAMFQGRRAPTRRETTHDADQRRAV